MGQEEERGQHFFSKAAEPAQGKKLQEISGAGKPSWKHFHTVCLSSSSSKLCLNMSRAVKTWPGMEGYKAFPGNCVMAMKAEKS